MAPTETQFNSPGMIALSILIASIEERGEQLKILLENKLKVPTYYSGNVEVIPLVDNKEISVGLKRQRLLEMANGKWIVYFDDDDDPYPWYMASILKGINTGGDIDCMGINVDMTTNGKRPQRCCHSLRYPTWREHVDEWDYVRNITHFNPVLKSKALATGFKDLRFGEDRDYSDRITPTLTKEYYITRPLFHYRFSNKQPHNQKYGII